MTQAEVAVLLALANGHDQRQGLDDVKVQAWFSLFQQEAPDMTGDWATGQINAHYADSTEMLMPAHLVRAWSRQRAQDRILSLTADMVCPHETPGGARYCALCRHSVGAVAI
jgi:hypothetical protein